MVPGRWSERLARPHVHRAAALPFRQGWSRRRNYTRPSMGSAQHHGPSEPALRHPVLHGVTGPPGGALARWLDTGPQLHGSSRPLVGPLPAIVAAVSVDADLLAPAEEGLPEGAARAEAVAVRLRRAGAPLVWGPPQPVRSLGDLERLCHARGRSSVRMIRADPSLVTELQVGAWFHPTWRGRAMRRLLLVRPQRWVTRVLGTRPLAMRTRADAAFWAGVRAEATSIEWRRLTRTSYVALLYHRIAGEARPGQENLDLPPVLFDAQMRLLRLLRFRPVPLDDLLSFHAGEHVRLPRRSYVVTADDAFLDCVHVLRRHAAARPQILVPTAAAGRTAVWAGGEPIADWPELADMTSAGAVVGAHSRRHRRLPAVDRAALDDEVAGSLDDLRKSLPCGEPVFAYPYGLHDHAVRRAVEGAGYRIAWTTERGRNGAGTDPFCLRRTEVHARDGRLGFLWKAVTGEQLPRWWEAWNVRREQRRTVRGERALERTAPPGA